MSSASTARWRGCGSARAPATGPTASAAAWATTGCSAAPGTTGSHGGLGRDRLDGGGQDDRLNGGAEADLLVGGFGADRFLFLPGSGRDVVADFRDDVDAIRLGGGFGFESAAEALERARAVGGDLVFAFGGGDRLTVRDTTRAEMADDLLV